jgi:hypothetical protein
MSSTSYITSFGHGKKHLSSLLLTLNLLAFLFHTVLEMMDAKYPLIRPKLPTRKTFFDDIRALTCYLCLEDWEARLTFIMRGLELEVPDTSYTLRGHNLRIAKFLKM